MHIPNDDTQNYSICRLQLVDETFGKLNLMGKPNKFNKSQHSCYAKEYGEYCIKHPNVLSIPGEHLPTRVHRKTFDITFSKNSGKCHV